MSVGLLEYFPNSRTFSNITSTNALLRSCGRSRHDKKCTEVPVNSEISVGGARDAGRWSANTMSVTEMTTPVSDGEPLEPDVGSELSVVPLDKDSFGLCERCGTIGLRKNFYARDNKFCSLYCYRSARSKRRNYRFALMSSADHLAGMIPMEPLPQLDQPWPADLHDIMRHNTHKSNNIISNSYEWKDEELFGCDFLAAPVKLFKHAPLYEMWDATLEGMKVEVWNTDCDNNKRLSDYFWVATVLKVKGYMGLLRYEGFGSDDSKDFWANLCCSDVHPVGWCATRGNPLIPPRSIEDKYSDWKKFLVKQLTGARTLPIDFYTKLEESLRSRFSIGTVMEVVDKDRITQVKVASVYEIIGKRLHVKYYDTAPEDEGFWCHEDSPLIHPVGWAFRVGHPLDAPQQYCERVAVGRLLSFDATPDMFLAYPHFDPVRPLFREGMKLEAIDPLNLSAICAATVMQVLRDGYMMIRIDVYPADSSNSDWFCYHQRSPCIFPVGFCAANNVRLIPPAGYSPDGFSWASYLSTCGAVAAGAELFAARSSVEHGFVAGMRIECADLMGPQLVCVATVARVVGNLLQVHFDGWGEEYDQWLHANSTDMYPVGWCRTVGYKLEGPLRPVPKQPPKQPKSKRQGRKRRKTNVPSKESCPPNSQTGLATEESSQNSQSDAAGDAKSLSPAVYSPHHADNAADALSHVDRHNRPAVDYGADYSVDNGVDEHEEAFKDVAEHEEDFKDVAEHEEDFKDVAEHEEDFKDVAEHEADFKNVAEHEEDFKDVAEHEEDFKDVFEHDEDGNDAVEHEEAVNNVAELEEAVHDVSEALPTEELEAKRQRIEDLNAHSDLDNLPEQTPDVVEEIEEPKAEECKVIPRLVNNTSFSPPPGDAFDPENWNTGDVAKFLAVNDQSVYCANFSHVNGEAMLKLSKDDIIELLEMKVGPSLKIFDLIQQLKSKLKPQSRMKFK